MGKRLGKNTSISKGMQSVMLALPVSVLHLTDHLFHQQVCHSPFQSKHKAD